MKLAYTISALAILSGGPAHAATEWWILSYGDTDRDQICEASDKSPADVLQSHKAIGDAVDIDKHGNEVDVTYGAESSGDAFTMRFFRDPQSCRDKLPKPIVSPVAFTVPLPINPPADAADNSEELPGDMYKSDKDALRPFRVCSPAGECQTGEVDIGPPGHDGSIRTDYFVAADGEPYGLWCTGTSTAAGLICQRGAKQWWITW